MWLDNFDSGYAEGNHENVVIKLNTKWNSAYFFPNFFFKTWETVSKEKTYYLRNIRQETYYDNKTEGSAEGSASIMGDKKVYQQKVIVAWSKKAEKCWGRIYSAW